MSFSIIREKLGPNSFPSQEYFFSLKNCVFHNILGFREMILEQAPNLSKYLVESNKKILAVWRTGHYEKWGAEMFFLRNDGLCFELNLVLNSLRP